MTLVAGKALLISGVGSILSDDDMPKAWAEPHVKQDPEIKWILGNYVEAEHPNSNGHIFPLADLVSAQDTVAHKPLNMVHREHYIVGAYAAARLLNPEGTDFTTADLEAADADTMMRDAQQTRPYMQALAGMWHNLFPDEFALTARAHAEGKLFYSMECQPATVTCPVSHAGGCAGACGVGGEALSLEDAHARLADALAASAKADRTKVFSPVFDGLVSETYCEAMNGRTHPKRLDKPQFKAGALIIPPVRPGWSNAEIKAIAKLVHDNEHEAEAIYAAVAGQSPHLDAKLWEQVMLMVMEQAHGLGEDQ